MKSMPLRRARCAAIRICCITLRRSRNKMGNSMKEPIIVPAVGERTSDQPPISAIGQSFDIYEWRGSGPDYLHVHYADDEAWHVLEGSLTFRFGDSRTVNASP